MRDFLKFSLKVYLSLLLGSLVSSIFYLIILAFILSKGG